MIDYNHALLNRHDLSTSFFHLDRGDPTIGFPYDASKQSGHTYPSALPLDNVRPFQVIIDSYQDFDDLLLRLHLGSHLAQYLRHQLEEHHGYTSTVGISTNKLLSKLVGNVNKPKGQTTLVPPYLGRDETSNVARFMDDHDIGKLPGIGFKMAQKIRNHVLGRPANFSAGLVYGGTKEDVRVRDVRVFNGMGPELLSRLLSGTGTPRDQGEKVWGLINGVDLSEVARARDVPQQISIVSDIVSIHVVD